MCDSVCLLELVIKRGTKKRSHHLEQYLSFIVIFTAMAMLYIPCVELEGTENSFTQRERVCSLL
jgi:hypothetical protein